MKNMDIEWSRLFQEREKIHNRYKEVWDIPLIKRRKQILKRFLKNGMSILDVGAGMKGIKEEIEQLGIQIDYKSMDIDRSIDHDFYDIHDIHESFDCIMLFEVIEHLSLQEGLDLLKTLRERMKDTGILILSTPNIFNPSRFMRDVTHRTFYAYDELCGLLTLAGYATVELYRSYNDALHRYIVKVYLLNFLFRILGIDYGYSIFVVAAKA